MDEENKLQFPSLPATKEDLLDWAYPMRREMQEILPGLFLGPYSAAMKSKLPILERQGITHIVCVRQDIEANFIKPNFPHTFRYLVLDIADNPVENIIRFFPTTKEFIDSCLATGGKVLVHGNAGISRSAALVIAYLMETFGMKYRDAFSHVQERRFCINPNVGFVHQLQEAVSAAWRKTKILEQCRSQQHRTDELCLYLALWRSALNFVFYIFNGIKNVNI
ncbi:serine/threonine/tyrosine-interacting protein isoform X2 [Seriola dumerili]|uniref:serine/threonine/tyrosine-interacting protein isoform X2 n=1 Tax=Seriola dumerili TaxID=41447 RepID=UPI000BBE84A0|nr:serine/threonine/tyrosine-interacting protein isoform X2 [Seriola dumerili]